MQICNMRATSINMDCQMYLVLLDILITDRKHQFFRKYYIIQLDDCYLSGMFQSGFRIDYLYTFKEESNIVFSYEFIYSQDHRTV